MAYSTDDAACQQAASSVHYTTSCKHSLVLLRMGEIIGRNMLSWLKLLINLLLLHLLRCLYYCISDARSHKHIKTNNRCNNKINRVYCILSPECEISPLHESLQTINYVKTFIVRALWMTLVTVNALCGQNVEVLLLNVAVFVLTTRLWRVLEIVRSVKWLETPSATYLNRVNLPRPHFCVSCNT